VRLKASSGIAKLRFIKPRFTKIPSGRTIGQQDVKQTKGTHMMPAIVVQMACVAGLLGLAVLAIVLGRAKLSTAVIYSATMAVSAIALIGSLRWLLGDPSSAANLTLPIGLPWLGAHFRMDALASFFLIVVNLGGAAASLYGLGYGHHDPAPERVLPFFPAFLARMNLVVMADDAFSFLLCWEFMSLASWALVMAHQS